MGLVNPIENSSGPRIFPFLQGKGQKDLFPKQMKPHPQQTTHPKKILTEMRLHPIPRKKARNRKQNSNRKLKLTHEEVFSMKNSHCIRMLYWQLATCSLGLCSLGFAAPSNPNAIQGTLNVENIDTKTWILTVSDDAYIFWDDFSISEDELIDLHQPSSKSIVVVEVVTTKPSVLLGTLKSNGSIYLINPHGVQIGENGYLDTCGFLASALPACPCPLIDGEHDVFVQGDSKAPITNKGRIKAWDNDVYLIGYQIENRGVVDASRGTVALAAGRDIVLNQSNGEKIGAFPSPIKYENEDVGIDNSGAIISAKTELKADGNSYAVAIRHSGYIDVLGTKEQKGQAYLVTSKGDAIISGAITVENENQTGGEIQILGEHIFIFENANLDASGEKGGGKVIIGADAGEPHPGVVAKLTFIDEDSSILVDAVEEGDGGKVIIGSEEKTCFYGAISACGGEKSGNGGVVEIFGKTSLDFQGEVDRLAPSGKEGVLLLSSHEMACTE
jgi:filamentous hemagglutinin family protein